jgi:hypothetical protein
MYGLGKIKDMNGNYPVKRKYTVIEKIKILFNLFLIWLFELQNR